MCRMKFLVLGASFLVSSVFMFWNLENCFDPYDDPLTRDEEFTPGGARHWTWKRLDRKLTGVAKVIFAAADAYGDYPALVGFCEVENATVLRRLVSNRLMAQLGYDWIHRDSPDGRGIDVALLFRRELFRPLAVRAVPVPTDPPARDILYVKGVLQGDTVHVLVNHWPSKLGGRAGDVAVRHELHDPFAQRLRVELCGGPEGAAPVDDHGNQQNRADHERQHHPATVHKEVHHVLFSPFMC